MEVLAGVVAVLVAASVVLRELVENSAGTGAVSHQTPRGAPARDRVQEPTGPIADDPAEGVRDEVADAAADVGPVDATGGRVDASTTAAVPSPPAGVVFAHAPVFATARTPGTTTIRIASGVSRVPAAGRPPSEPARVVEPSRAVEPPRVVEPAQPTVLGVFRDTEPDGRTEGTRRAASALVLAAVTAVVATGVGGVIYLGLSRLG